MELVYRFLQQSSNAFWVILVSRNTSILISRNY